MREERIFSASSYVFTFSASSMPSLFIMTRTRAGSECDGTPFILQDDGREPVERPEDVEPLRAEKTACHGEALGAVVVPADDDEGNPSLSDDFLSHAVKELDGIFRRK